MQVGGHQASRQTIKLYAKIANGEGFVALRLDGVIDEHNQLGQTVEALGKAEVLAVDLGGIRRLNSVGVRDWVNWLRAVRKRYPTVLLFDCPAPVMNEVNFVKNFAEGAYITTFAAPLYCPRCEKEESRRLETHKILGGNRQTLNGSLALPSFRCDRTDCENALDDDEESYFAFLRTLPETRSSERLVEITEQARALLASSGVALSQAPAPPPLPLENTTAGRSQPLGQVGLRGVPRPSQEIVPPSFQPAAGDPGPLPPPVTSGGDWLFIAAMVAMVGVLGVLIYLILTLE